MAPPAGGDGAAEAPSNLDAVCNSTPLYANATRTTASAGGGCKVSFASRLRFCAIAASVNSNCAPLGPRRRNRPSRRMRFQVGEQHLDLLPIAARLRERLGRGDSAGNIASLLVDAAENPPGRRLRTALRVLSGQPRQSSTLAQIRLADRSSLTAACRRQIACPPDRCKRRAPCRSVKSSR